VEGLMLKLTRSICVDAAASAVWAVLSDLDGVHLWVDSIHRAECPGQDRGVGAVRVCELRQATVRETVVEWDEGRSFMYRGDGAPMMASATNRWSVEAYGERSLVTSTAEITLKGGAVGRLLEPVLRPIVYRLGGRSLASLKYLVEEGHPHPRGGRGLAAIPSVC
jgi:carbon monoxide dehydrogenase subunit G